MKTIVMVLLFSLFASAAMAAAVETVIVGRCEIEVLVMKTSQEHAKGLLGYTERTFPYGGMLFEMNSRQRKIFHTQGMQMPIRIMGVVKSSNGSYRVMGSVIQAPPGLESIAIDAPDILEIPESKYQRQYKRCLGAPEAK